MELASIFTPFQTRELSKVCHPTLYSSSWRHWSQPFSYFPHLASRHQRKLLTISLILKEGHVSGEIALNSLWPHGEIFIWGDIQIIRGWTVALWVLRWLGFGACGAAQGGLCEEVLLWCAEG